MSRRHCSPFSRSSFESLVYIIGIKNQLSRSNMHFNAIYEKYLILVSYPLKKYRQTRSNDTDDLIEIAL